MAIKRSTAMLACGLMLAGCAQAPGLGRETGEITTGSILPAMPALPKLPSTTALLPSVGTAKGPRSPERVSGNLFRVFANDRRIDDPVQRENYALPRAAESAREVGGTHFIVVDPTKVRPDVGGGSASGGPGTALIRVLRHDSDNQPPTGAISVDEIITFFGPTFGREA